ncbi:hypothetical protein Y032_0091g2464 [Ancylostoma ceylanicum]|uniref:Uncharacterized protein n=1 Tax=Ancylostoma ceylanicum TaxID=53326 RepID=A0A016TMH5_9BILA|nr:hypothetical protein Y032_0091g2464 [Ancylostoma ceylanicum]
MVEFISTVERCEIPSPASYRASALEGRKDTDKPVLKLSLIKQEKLDWTCKKIRRKLQLRREGFNAGVIAYSNDDMQGWLFTKESNEGDEDFEDVGWILMSEFRIINGGIFLVVQVL